MPLIRITATQNTASGKTLFEVFTIADRKNERTARRHLRAQLAMRARLTKTQLTGEPAFGEIKEFAYNGAS
ncbi:MAG TPA: hypothetical protein VFA55_07175 [Candidatus Kapabacteria bacterium]|nr:hypothetical protein [Candidatus Kapabacteria bacterium]